VGTGVIAVQPGLIVAGTNPVVTDATCMRLMCLDPMADRGAHPFEHCDNMLLLAEQAGIGTRDSNRIEVIGAVSKMLLSTLMKLKANLASPTGFEPVYRSERDQSTRDRLNLKSTVGHPKDVLEH